MRREREPEELRDVRVPLVLAVGFFDGVHLGHQAVLQAGQSMAGARGGEAWALTFDPHPLVVLRPEEAPPILTPLPMKERCIERLGMQGCLVMPFSRALAGTEPEAFVDRLRAAIPSLCGVCVGPRWSFGRGGRGDARLLQRMGAAAGWDVAVVPQVRVGGAPVSSTRVRRAVVAGRMEDAARLLGRPHAISGLVQPGRRIGRTLGFPTANVDPGSALLPPFGVYAARIQIRGEAHPAAAYIGTRPTFEPSERPVLEVHVLDFDGLLYREHVEVELLKRIRGDRRFESVESLRRQIERDVESVMQFTDHGQAQRALPVQAPRPL